MSVDDDQEMAMVATIGCKTMLCSPGIVGNVHVIKVQLVEIPLS